MSSEQLRSGMWAVMFTDLVDSTAQRARVGDAAADAIRREHDAIVRRAAATNGGTVIKGTGDGAMALFSAAADAITAGVVIQQGIDRRNRSGREPVGLRIGISLGDLAYEMGDVHGMAANEAARVCSIARAGDVLITELVRAVAGTRCTSDLTDLGAAELKGLPDPVVIWRVEWEPAPAHSAPLPPTFASSTTPFVGRGNECRELESAWQDALTGHARIVLVLGEAGVGKSRLAMEAARRAHNDGAMVLHGRCSSAHGMAAYEPFAEALTWYCEQTLHPVLGRYPAELARLSPAVATVTGPLDAALRAAPDTEQHRLFDAVRSWIQTAADQQPMVLVLEDVHLGTEATAAMIRQVVGRDDAGRLLLILTARDTDQDDARDVRALADLKAMPKVLTLPLSGLDDAAVRELVGVELDLDERRCEQLSAELLVGTGGNPFFLGEILQTVRQTGSTNRRDGDGLIDTVPETVRAAVEARATRLTAETRSILTTAAVIGGEFDLTTLARVLDADAVKVVLALEEARAAHLLDEVGLDRFAFVHALVQSTLADGWSTSARTRLHRKIAEVLGRSESASSAAVAFHWCASAALGDVNEILSAVIAAARDAFDRSDPEAADTWYSQGVAAVAAACGRNTDRRDDALVWLHEHAGDDSSLAGRHRSGYDHYRTAMEHLARPSVTRARLHRKVACGMRTRQDYREAIDAFDAATSDLDQVDTRDDQWHYEWLQTELDRMELYYWSNLPEEMSRIEQTIATPMADHGSDAQRADFAKNRAMRRLRETRYVIDDATIELFTEAVDRSQRSDAPARAFHVFNRGFAALWQRRSDDARRDLHDALTAAERVGDVVVAARCLTYLTVADRFDQDGDGLRRHVARAWELARSCELGEYLAAADANRAWLLLREDRPEQARAAAEEAVNRWRHLGITYAFQWLAWFPLLRLAHDQGDTVTVRSCATAMLQPDQQRLIELESHLTATVDGLDATSTLLDAAATLGYV